MKIKREIVYIIYVRNFWICRKIEYPNCGNSTGKLRTLHTYGMSGFVEKIEYPELRKFNGKLYTLYIYGMVGFVEKLNVQNCGNSTGNCVQYLHGMSEFAEKLNVQNCVNSTENCVHYFCTKCLDL